MSSSPDPPADPSMKAGQLLLFTSVVACGTAAAVLFWLQFSRRDPRSAILGMLALMVIGIVAAGAAVSIGID
jgi:hypothetical protein